MRRILPILATAATLVLSASAAQAQFFFFGNQNSQQTMFDPATGQPMRMVPRSDGGPHVGASAIPRETVSYSGRYAPGTIVISTQERRLYLVQSGGTAIRYGVGVGRPGFTWGGTQTITRKAEWPDWRPPSQMLRRRPDLPRFMAGGPQNPLGARAMYLGSSLYRIHGSNEPHTIGTAVSSGCFRLTNDDVVDLYSRVRVGTRVVVTR
jgi:lipoprotein-anchoring transpeptidase ErfK/SrfK